QPCSSNEPSRFTAWRLFFVVFAPVSIPDGQRAILAVFARNTRANIQPCGFVAGHVFLAYSYNQNDRFARLPGACIVPRSFFNSPGFAVSPADGTRFPSLAGRINLSGWTTYLIVLPVPSENFARRGKKVWKRLNRSRVEALKRRNRGS